MRAALRAGRDTGEAEGAILHRRSRGRFRLRHELVQPPYDHEDAEADDEEIDDRGKEYPVVQGHRPSCLRRGQGGVRPGGRSLLQHGEKACEVRVSQGQADRRHEDVFHQGLDYGPEGATQDNTDREVHHVSAQDECLEFLEQRSHTPQIGIPLALK